jgi:site-specific recombinase XerD
MGEYSETAGLPPEKRQCQGLKHSIATRHLDARGTLHFVQDLVDHKNLQNTRIYAQITNPLREQVF